RMPLSITPSPSPVRAKSAGVIIFLFDRKRAVSYQIKSSRCGAASATQDAAFDYAIAVARQGEIGGRYNLFV
ncbi:MAG: hypothetical protein IJS90_08975, partial [Clostridia bacterium]|nr:hypothetical protein [Clostridia bacterium]